jgi:adenylosuccinate synthase
MDLLEKNLKEKSPLLKQITPVSKLRKEIIASRRKLKKFIAPFVANTSVLLDRAIKKKRNVLFESAQGTLLDMDFGTYPFVTSSNPISAGACTGSGVGPTKINKVLGVVKAYTTRVGEGPFPTELNNAVGQALRQVGQEYGATTGRPRRCGWFDAVIVRHSVRVNGIDKLVITKLDCLEGLDTLKICTGYKYKGKVIKEFPASRSIQAKCVPVYISMKGFKGSVRKARNFKQLPLNAQKYLRKIEELVGCRINLISLGRKREETILVEKKDIWS